MSDGTVFKYDPNGNMVTLTKGTNNTQYAFDSQNRLQKVIVGNLTVASYLYDGDGGRTAQRNAAIAGQQFTLQRNIFRQPVEQDIEINLARESDIEAWVVFPTIVHTAHAVSLRITTWDRLRGESGSSPFFSPV